MKQNKSIKIGYNTMNQINEGTPCTPLGEQKYYTPELEDLRIGYEYELFIRGEYAPTGEDPEFLHGQWSKLTIEACPGIYGYGHNVSIPRLNQMRVPYLTKEQIEAEGWKIIEGSTTYTKGNYYCYPYKLREVKESFKSMIHIYQVYDLDKQKALSYYLGICPSINEFRTICKLLNIK